MGAPQTNGVGILWGIRCEAQAPLQPTKLEILVRRQALRVLAGPQVIVMQVGELLLV